MGFYSFLKYNFIIFAAHLATSCNRELKEVDKTPDLVEDSKRRRPEWLDGGGGGYVIRMETRVLMNIYESKPECR
jgi:hypothetical protein